MRPHLDPVWISPKGEIIVCHTHIEYCGKFFRNEKIFPDDPIEKMEKMGWLRIIDQGFKNHPVCYIVNRRINSSQKRALWTYERCNKKRITVKYSYE